MNLYHGTSSRFLDAIRADGLVPRGPRDSNWAIESRADLVYLTDGAYALHFASAALAGREPYLFVEVDTARLDPGALRPDEDFLEQASRGMTRTRGGRPLPPKRRRTMEARTAWFRTHLEAYADNWGHSVSALGTCAHRGVIPATAITRAVTLDQRHPIGQFVDPSISLLNHKILGDRYRNIMRWIMGETVTPDEISSLPTEAVQAQMGEAWAFFTERRARTAALLADRTGWQMVIGAEAVV